jgi:hypothetical protein
MARSLIAALGLLFLIPAPASAAELAGVTMSATTTIGGEAMVLQGLGLRTKFRFKVYVSGLYLSKADANPVTFSGGKAIRMHMLRALDSSKVGDSIESGFEKNSAASMGELRARLDQLKAMFPSVKAGDIVTLAWIPGKGTVVWSGGEELGSIEGEDFAQALFKVWFGGDPVQQRLADGMLGK